KIDLIRRFSPGAKKILDIGAGIGGFKSLAEENGYDVIGIEPEESQVNIAKINFNVDLVCTTFESFSQSNNTKFDVIHLHHVLEHLRNPKKILLEIKNMLNDTGILIVEVPNQFFVLSKEIYVKLGKIKLKKPYNPYHHVNFFSPSTLKKLFEDCSYKIIELNQPKKYSKKLLHRVYLLLANIIKMGISTRIEIIANKI
ncbi:MAG: class I SAM-dependent methyltransferase, partial [Promethearchaeota archaeon]